MRIRALLVLGTMVSPELEREHLTSGQASPAAETVFRLSAARAMGFGDEVEKVSLLSLRLAHPPQAVRSQVSSVGPLVADIHMDFCAAGATELPHGADFEHRFVLSVQDFAAFHPSALRLLELEDLSPAGQGPAPAPPPGPRPQALRSSTLPPSKEVPSWVPQDVVLWLLSAMLAATTCLGAVAWRFARRRRRLKEESERLEFEVAVSGAYDAGASAAGPSSHVTTVLVAFDPTSEDGRVFAGAAGLEPSECLKVTLGDVMEIIAFGEGWLYGRILGAEMFGYLPEECVQRVPHTPPASAAVLEGGLARSVAAAAAA